jgi:hypothetical protein
LSGFGTKRTYRDDLLLARFRATADIHARVASTASVVNDPKQTNTPLTDIRQFDILRCNSYLASGMNPGRMEYRTVVLGASRLIALL